MIQAADDPVGQARAKAFQRGLQQLGWTDGRNVQTNYRWAAGNVENARKYAAELVALAPDVILVQGAATGSVLQATRTVPIVFTNTGDPVGSGFVDSLSRPGGNATGFMLFEYSMSAKWVELLKQIAPGVTRAAVLRDPSITSGIGQFSVIQSVAPSVGVEVSPINAADDIIGLYDRNAALYDKDRLRIPFEKIWLDQFWRCCRPAARSSTSAAAWRSPSRAI